MILQNPADNTRKTTAEYVTGRDIVRERDSSDIYREHARTQILRRLADSSVLAPHLGRYTAQQLFEFVYLGENPRPMEAQPSAAAFRRKASLRFIGA